MAQRLNGKLECAECHKVYLRIPAEPSSDSPIFCSSCGNLVGRWGDIESSFIEQGGLNGVFEMVDGHIIRRG